MGLNKPYPIVLDATDPNTPDVIVHTSDGRAFLFDFKTRTNGTMAEAQKQFEFYKTFVEEIFKNMRPQCPHCGELAPYGDARIGWSDWHESRHHRLWYWLRRKILWDR